jgi:hypothetical protein
LNRIELTSRLIDAENFQAKALGLIQEVVLHPGPESLSSQSSGRVLSCDASTTYAALKRSLNHPEKNSFAAICIASSCLSDAGIRQLVRASGRDFPLMIELHSDELLLLDDDQEFNLLNQCEDLRASVHLELDDYRENWSEQIRQALIRLSGFVGSLGLPVPEFSPRMDEQRIQRIEAELDALLTSVSKNFDISVLSFRNHRVGVLGTIEAQRFWHGL